MTFSQIAKLIANKVRLVYSWGVEEYANGQDALNGLTSWLRVESVTADGDTVVVKIEE